MAIYFHWDFGIKNKLLEPIINKKTAAKIIRNDPNCIADKPIKPFFMSINELPHIRERISKKTHFKFFEIICQNLGQNCNNFMNSYGFF